MSSNRTIEPLPSVPSTDPTVNKLKTMPNTFSPEWFDVYNSADKKQQAQFKRHLHEKNPHLAYDFIVKHIETKRAQAKRAEQIQATINTIPSPLKTKPKVMRSMVKPKQSFTLQKLPESIYNQCAEIKQTIEKYLELPLPQAEKYPNIYREYNQKIIDQINKLRTEIKNDCFVNGRVPNKAKFFEPLNKLLAQMHADMVKQDQTPKTSQGGKTRKYKRKKRGKSRRKTKRSGRRVR